MEPVRIKWLNRCEALTERLRHTRYPGDYPEEEGKGREKGEKVGKEGRKWDKRGEEKEEEEEEVKLTPALGESTQAGFPWVEPAHLQAAVLIQSEQVPSTRC